jgi:hypothetical protein
MTRLVVHLGGARTATTCVQRGLAANESVLADHGVLLPTAGRFELEHGTLAHHGLALGLSVPDGFVDPTAGWAGLAEEVAATDATVALVSSPLFEPLVRRAATRTALEQRLRAVSDSVTVVYVVRDQLSQLNGSYVTKASRFVEVGTFSASARRALKSGGLNLNRAFAAWVASDVLELVALPFPELVTGDPLPNLLAAAGVDVPPEQLVGHDHDMGPPPGPVAVEAFRLLGQHLRAIDPSFSPWSDAARKLRDVALGRARANGWCEDDFWGWEHQQAEQVAKRMQPPNQHFAEAVWGGDWPLPLPVDRQSTGASLVGVELSQLTGVQRYVSLLARNYVELRAGLPLSPPPDRLRRAAGGGRRDRPAGPGTLPEAKEVP